MAYLALNESRGYAALVNTRQLGDVQTAMQDFLATWVPVIGSILGIKSSPVDL